MQKLKTILILTALILGALCSVRAASRSLPEEPETDAEPVVAGPYTASTSLFGEGPEAEKAELERIRREFKEARDRRPSRKLRRFGWRSPAATRGQLWNIPEEESVAATVEAFLRVCLVESSGHLPDCVGIWQVAKNVRRRSCARDIDQRITECEEGGRETYLSALRRTQHVVLGEVTPKSRRARWISKLTTDCEPPEDYDGSQNHWDTFYAKRCQRVVELGSHLVKGQLPPRRSGHRLGWLPHHPITWGGRCETRSGACDDHLACARGLVRIPDTNTKNAFWCRPGRRSCPEGIDPICQKYREAFGTHVVTKEMARRAVQDKVQNNSI